jgi:hypothetical protein
MSDELNIDTVKAIERFRTELLRLIDEFCEEHSTTIEESRGADVIADIIRRMNIGDFLQ